MNFAYYSFGPLEEIMGNASQQPFPTLLIITGYSATTSSWPPKLLRDLAQDRAIIFADNPGIGFSTTAENTSALLLPAQADAYADLITALGLGPNTSSPKPSVMGWSMGGAITLELAAAHGAMFDKFITIAGFSDRHFVTNETYPLPELASAPEGLRDLLGLVAVLFPNTSSGVAAACDYLQGVLSMPPDPASPESIGRQLQGIVQWGAGVRPRLEGINNSVLVFQVGLLTLRNKSWKYTSEIGCGLWQHSVMSSKFSEALVCNHQTSNFGILGNPGRYRINS